MFLINHKETPLAYLPSMISLIFHYKRFPPVAEDLFSFAVHSFEEVDTKEELTIVPGQGFLSDLICRSTIRRSCA